MSNHYQHARAVTVTTTGNIDDLNFSKAGLIRMNNASLATIRGLQAGWDGQRISIVSIGAGHVELAHQNANSSAANRLINHVTGGNTPLAAGVGTATYQYDATTARWRLIHHEQGVSITPTFSAGDYTGSGSMTWTVDSGDVSTFAYTVRGRRLIIDFTVKDTDVGGTASISLQRTLPGGYTAAAQAQAEIVYSDAGAANVIGYVIIVAAGTTLLFRKLDNSNWTLTTGDNTTVAGVIELEIS